MEVKKVIKQNGEYQCDIDVTVEEWKEVLQDKSLMNDNYKDVLLKFLSEPEHKSTCKALSEKYGASPQSYNGTITNFAKVVQKKLNRFEVIGVDGTPSFWIIPMTGKHAGEHFEWTMRPELVKAIEETFINENYLRFKKLLEYFVAHLEFCVTNDKSNDKYNIYIKDVKNFNKSGQGYKGQKIQNQIKDWDTYPNGKICININATVYKTGGCYLNWDETAINVNAIWEKDSISKLKLVKDSYPLSNSKDVLIFSVNDLGLFKDNSPNNNLKTFFDKFNELIINYKKEQKKRGNMLNLKPYIELLETNKNLILTGAPGTGKTYLAKEIAKEMIGVKTEQELIDSGKFEIVQFHPSYDYTDFVEGLRPTAPDENGNIGFKLKDGVFKSFCKRACSQDNTDNFDELYTDFIDELSEKNIELKTPTHKKKFKVEINSNKTCVAIPDTDIGTRMSITKEMIKGYVLHGDTKDWKPYTIPIAEYFKEHYEIKTEKAIQNESPFVFIIDEINRAEISKVFGELFFSIDPGYRGEDGKVKTQYANLQDADDIFADGFFVPENVYIIGTMNDIDRSVESMDFAMRRRFAWKEVKAEDRISMWDGQIDTWKDEALKRMNSLNKAIESVQGLGSAYHIGPAYFLKLENYREETDPFESLWNNHLEGVIFEYLRGLPDSEELMSKLKNAYNKLTDVEND